MSFFKTLIGLNALEQQEADSRARVEQYGRDLERDNQIKNQQYEINRLRNEANGVAPPSQQEIALRERIEKLEAIEQLLSRPMAEIAQKNSAFKDSYMRQQELLANLVVSQKAFQEIAMQYGKALGKTPEEIIQEAKHAEEAVKNGSIEFDTSLNADAQSALGYTERKQEEDKKRKEAQDEKAKKIFEVLGYAEKRDPQAAEFKAKIKN